jgi:hypothetical protein
VTLRNSGSCGFGRGSGFGCGPGSSRDMSRD